MHGLERGLRRALIVLRLGQRVLRSLPVLQRHRLAGIEIVLTLLVDLRQVELGARAVERAQRRDEIVQRLHGVGGFDHEQRLAALDRVAGLDQQLRHAAGIGREHRRRGILVDGDLAFGDVLGAELLLLGRFEGEARPLRIGRREAPRIFLRGRDGSVDFRARRTSGWPRDDGDGQRGGRPAQSAAAVKSSSRLMSSDATLCMCCAPLVFPRRSARLLLRCWFAMPVILAISDPRNSALATL